ncbi:MAG: hypothetical protein ACYCT2_04355 [Thermoplasmataceae archaeon]
MNFEEYVKESIEHIVKIKEKMKETFGNIDRDLELVLVKAAIEPWGLVKNPKQEIQRAKDTATGRNEAPTSGIAEIIAKYDLVEDNGLLKPRKFLDHGFKDLAQALEIHGYRYNKEKKVFMPPWNGVKR